MSNIQLPTTGTISGVAEQGYINTALAALTTMLQGATAPTTSSSGLSSMAGVWWHNTSTNVISIRDQADTTWITVGTINESTKTFTPAGVSGTSYLPTTGGTLTGSLTISIGGVTVSTGGLNVAAGGASITGNAAVSGNIAASGTLSIGGAATFSAAASFGGQVSLPASGLKFNDGSILTTAPSLTGYAATSMLATYAPLASPGLTGTPTAPTPATGANSNQIATTSWVNAAISAGIAAYVAALAAASSAGGNGGGGG